MIALAPSMFVALVLQSTWIVDASNGPGTNFTSLPAAVAAAASGDTLIVRSGTYAPFVVSGKALTIRGAGAASTVVMTFVSNQQTVISAVPAGLVFYVSGMAFGPAPSSIVTTSDPIRVTGPGEVVISDAVLTGFDASSGGCAALWVEGGAVVHATRCSLTGGGANNGFGGNGVWIRIGSVLAADASTFTGGGGSAGFFTSGGHGLSVEGGFATLSRCSAAGGADPFGAAGSGVRVSQNGFARIAGTGADVIQAGAMGTTQYSVFVSGGTSSAIVHGSVHLVHSTAGAVTTGAPSLPYVSVTGTSAGGGQLQAASPVTVTFVGLPFATYFCGLDLSPWFSTAFTPLAVGELLIPVPAAPTLQGTFDSTGMLQFSVTPSLTAPGLMDLPIYLQIGVVDSAAGNIRLSNGLVRVFKT